MILTRRTRPLHYLNHDTPIILTFFNQLTSTQIHSALFSFCYLDAIYFSSLQVTSAYYKSICRQFHPLRRATRLKSSLHSRPSWHRHQDRPYHLPLLDPDVLRPHSGQMAVIGLTIPSLVCSYLAPLPLILRVPRPPHKRAHPSRLHALHEAAPVANRPVQRVLLCQQLRTRPRTVEQEQTLLKESFMSFSVCPNLACTTQYEDLIALLTALQTTLGLLSPNSAFQIIPDLPSPNYVFQTLADLFSLVLNLFHQVTNLFGRVTNSLSSVPNLLGSVLNPFSPRHVRARLSWAHQSNQYSQLVSKDCY